MEAPLRPALSTVFEPSLVVNVPDETSRQSAERESNSQPGLRSHMALIRGLCADHGQRCAAIGFGIGRLAIEEECAFAGNHGIGAGSLVGTAARREMREMIGEFVVDRPRRSVVQGVLEDGAGNSGVLVVERNEGVPGDQRHVERNGLIGKANLGERELAAEIAFLEARKAFGSAAAQTLALQVPGRRF